jgi:hypothetical protein
MHYMLSKYDVADTGNFHHAARGELPCSYPCSRTCLVVPFTNTPQNIHCVAGFGPTTMLLLAVLRSGAHRAPGLCFNSAEAVLCVRLATWQIAATAANKRRPHDSINKRLAFSSEPPASQSQSVHAAQHSDPIATPVGGYTPITKQLWLERLSHGKQGGGTGLHGQHRQGGPARDDDVVKSVTYAFSSDAVLREMYRNPWDKIRVGRVMEDLDSLAGVHWVVWMGGGPAFLCPLAPCSKCLPHDMWNMQWHQRAQSVDCKHLSGCEISALLVG